MGRPVNKNRMSVNNTLNGGNASLSGKIAVTAYRPFGGSKVDSVTAYVVAQRASRLFKIHLEDSTEVVMKLVAVAPGSLSAADAGGYGQFCVQVILSDSTVAYVEKFYNRTIHYVTTAGAPGTVKYSLGTEATDETAEANFGTINVR
jgi:hypothetical protein